MQQSEITRSLANETLQFEQNIREQLLSQRKCWRSPAGSMTWTISTHTPQMSRLLQDFIENNHNILYVTAVDRQAKGPTSGSFNADRDPSCKPRSSALSLQHSGLRFHQRAVRAGERQSPRPGDVRSAACRRPVYRNVCRRRLARPSCSTRIRDASVRDRTVYIVNMHGQIVAYPDTRDWFPAETSLRTSPLVKQIGELPKELRATQTTNF